MTVVVCVVLFVSLAIGGGVAVWRRRGKLVTADRQFEQGCCMTCGYDVRSSAARCPECGDDLVAQVVRYYGPRLNGK